MRVHRRGIDLPGPKRRTPSRADLEKALAESVKLQSHYAEQLNMYDGGERMKFDSADAWISRLRETGDLA